MEKEFIVAIPKGFHGTITIKLVIEEDKQTVYNVDRNDRNDVDQHSDLIIKPKPTQS